MLKNITLSAEESLIRKGRQRAAEEHKSLNELFRAWMARYVGDDDRSAKYQLLMQKLSHARPGRSFSREEMNER
jgi:hypothetical protein